jgi:plasmid maintenance system antidote protein VapI
VQREVPLIHAGTAPGLSIFFGTDAQSWGNLQTHYETEYARVALADVLGRIVRRELADAVDTAHA